MKKRTRKELKRAVCVELVSYELPGGHLGALLGQCAQDLDEDLDGSIRVREAMLVLASRLDDASKGLMEIAREIPQDSPHYSVSDDGTITMPVERAELIADCHDMIWVEQVDCERKVKP